MSNYVRLKSEQKSDGNIYREVICAQSSFMCAHPVLIMRLKHPQTHIQY